MSDLRDSLDIKQVAIEPAGLIQIHYRGIIIDCLLESRCLYHAFLAWKPSCRGALLYTFLDKCCPHGERKVCRDDVVSFLDWEHAHYHIHARGCVGNPQYFLSFCPDYLAEEVKRVFFRCFSLIYIESPWASPAHMLNEGINVLLHGVKGALGGAAHDCVIKIN